MTTSVQRLLATRAARHHRSAWSAVLAALTLTALLLGALALALTSTALGHPRVEARAAAPVVVAGDQTTTYTAKPWGSEPRTEHAALTERVRVPHEALRVVRGVEGVRAAIPDDTFALPRAAGERGAAPLTGRSWDAAALAPYGLREGRAPRHAGEIVAGAPLRAAPGQQLAGRRVVGVAEGPATGYVTATEARRLAGHPRSIDAVGVLAEPGTSTATLDHRIRAALDRAGLHDTSAPHRADGDSAALRVLTGNGRGAAEDLTAAPARTTLLELMGSVSAALVLVALLVITSLTAQALHQREGELRLLRAVGATPRQLRAAVGREVTRTAIRAALYGSLAAMPAFLALWAWLRARGAVPGGLELPTPGWMFAAPLGTGALVVGAARLAALLACARTARERPAHVSTATGRGRRVAGLVLLSAGASAAGTAAAQRGDAAAAAAGAAALTLVTGCALLGPWIAAGAMRLLGPPLRRLGGPGGWLAVANGTANSRRLGAAITPVVLVTAFVLVQLAAGSTLRAHAGNQASAAQRAALTVTAPGGLPGAALDRVRAAPGVTAATGVREGTVVLARKEAGEPRLERLPALGVTPEGLTRTLDPGVTEGALAGLRPGTVAVGADRARAQGLTPGSTVRLRFGDGAERPLKVVALYERSLALGDFLLARSQLARHTTESTAERALVATARDTDARQASAGIRAALAETAPGARLAPARPLDPASAEGEAAGQALTATAVVAIAGLAALAVLSTLRLISAGRRREFALLHGVGAGRGQLRRMLGAEAAVVALSGLALGTAAASLPLLAISFASTRSLPYLPPAQGLALVAGVALTTAAGTLLPARRALNRPALSA